MINFSNILEERPSLLDLSCSVVACLRAEDAYLNI